MPSVSILMPAFHSESFIAHSVRSVLAQTLPDWELIVIADDGVDYQRVLAEKSIKDSRIRCITSRRMQSGPSAARNDGLDAARADIIAMLDSDDMFAPDKLARVVPLVKAHSFVTSEIAFVMREEGGALIPVGDFKPLHAGGVLTPSDYPRVHYQGNMMVALDRKRVPIRWPEQYPVLNDLLFAIQAYDYIPYVWHIAEPLHYYIRRAGSLATSDNAPQRYIQVKNSVLESIAQGAFYVRNAEMLASLQRFLTISLEAEHAFEAMRKTHPGITFQELLLRRLEA